MNFRRTRGKPHVVRRDPPRRRRGPDRPLLLARGGREKRELGCRFKERCGRCRTRNVYSG